MAMDQKAVLQKQQVTGGVVFKSKVFSEKNLTKPKVKVVLFSCELM